MKILQIFPGKVWGGAEQYVLDLGNALQARGHQMYYVACDCQAVAGRLEKEIEFIALPFMGVLDLLSIYRLSLVIKERALDVIHLHDIRFVSIVMIARFLAGSKARVVFTRHVARASRVTPLFRPLFKKLHRIIFVSELARCLWLSVNQWMPREKCKVIHNSIPAVVDEMGNESLRRKYHIADGTPLIVFTGRIRRSKGCAVLIEALATIKEFPFHVVFIGNCKPQNYQTKLIKMARHHGLAARISFYGFSNQTRNLISEADIGVAPSLVREACPLSPMEFMQVGRCVITTNNGAQPEYIQSFRTGVLVSPGNVEELAHALRLLIADEKLRQRISRHAKWYFEHHMGYGQFIDKILACYS